MNNNATATSATVVGKLFGYKESLSDIGKKQKGKKQEEKKPTDLFDTFEQASSELHKRIMGLDVTDPNVFLVTSTPGLGKTEAGMKKATALADDGTKVLFASQTRDMCWQLHDRFTGGFHNISASGQHDLIFVQGRHNGYTRMRINELGLPIEIPVAPNCHRNHDVEKAREKGYPIQEYVCAKCVYCPHYRNENGQLTGYYGACDYFKTLYRASGVYKKYPGEVPIVLMTHKMFSAVACSGDLLQPNCIICDEDPVYSLREQFSWTELELEREVDCGEIKSFRDLMLASIHVAKMYKGQAMYPMSDKVKTYDKTKAGNKLRKAIKNSSEFGAVTLFGKNLARIMWKASQIMGHDIDVEQILEAAATADVGIKKGEFVGMSQKRFDRLPHHKEPELAAALLDVYKNAKQGKEEAYKVSLRWSKERGWSVEWDYVSRVGYGGAMIVLDAYGDKDIVARYMQREVTETKVLCKVRDNVAVTVFPDIRTSKASMENDAHKDLLFNKYLAPKLHEYDSRKVLIYIQKRYVPWLRDKIDREKIKFKALQIKWFWMDRGDNAYNDFDSVIIFGTPVPNIVEERHFANALFAGEEPLDWECGKAPTYTPNDKRVIIQRELRQEKEMLQAVFRIRPSKPREENQEIVIFSKMKLDIKHNLTGCISKESFKPIFHDEDFDEATQCMYDELGVWVDDFAGLTDYYEWFIKWVNSGGSNSGAPFILSFDDLMTKKKVFMENSASSAILDKFIKKYKIKNTGMYDYNGRKVRYIGDKEKIAGILNQIAIATRDPGCDDDDDNGEGDTCVYDNVTSIVPFIQEKQEDLSKLKYEYIPVVLSGIYLEQESVDSEQKAVVYQFPTKGAVVQEAQTEHTEVVVEQIEEKPTEAGHTSPVSFVGQVEQSDDFAEFDVVEFYEEVFSEEMLGKGGGEDPPDEEDD
jgi:hypothetical protein